MAVLMLSHVHISVNVGPTHTHAHTRTQPLKRVNESSRDEWQVIK